MNEPYIIAILLFAVATLYSMVGHGGASGYLAVLSLTSISTLAMSSTSLVLNLFVAGISFAFYCQSKFFRWELTWPFLISAVPLAFLGAMAKIPPEAYSLILGITLVFAAYRLLINHKKDAEKQTISVPKSLGIGGVIGILSGMLGIGGGIFLSPVILFLRWADPKETAATSSIFILVNSLAGLAGKVVSQRLSFPPNLWMIVLVCVLGALAGAYLGAKKLAPRWIRIALACVLLTAAIKLIF